MDKKDLFLLLERYNAGEVNDTIFDKYAIMMFLFSWFEQLVFNEEKQKNYNTLSKICDDLSKGFSEYDELLLHFKNRYFPNGKESYVFEETYKRKNKEDEKKHIEKVLTGDSSDNKDKILTCFQIGYVFRNNTFHGNKYLENFCKYCPEIDIINNFLFSVINYCLNKNYHGYNEVKTCPDK